MSFQQRPQRRTPRCPWCDQEMVPSPDSRGGRLFCPTGEAVEYRLSGGRWYFNGRLNGLDEPIPPAPDDGDPTGAGEDEAADSSKRVEMRDRTDASAPAAPSAPPEPTEPVQPESLDPLDAFRQIASDAWGAADADEEAE